MRVGAARPVLAARRPGSALPREDAVYQFVTMIARGYLGQPVWNNGTPPPPLSPDHCRSARPDSVSLTKTVPAPLPRPATGQRATSRG